MDQQITENVRLIQHECVKLNNLIEKYSIYMTHSYLPAMQNNQSQDSLIQAEHEINTVLNQIKNDLNTVRLQISRFSEVSSALTPDQERQHKSSLNLVASLHS